MPTPNTNECAFRRKIVALTSKTNLLMALLSHADDSLAQQKKEIEQRDVDLAQRAAEIALRDVDLAQRDAEIAHRDEELARLQGISRQNEELALRVAAVEHRLEQLLTSKSWRMTAPVRALRRSLIRVVGSRRST
jgi:uncharacterized protein (DUF3084 family)